MSYGTDCRFVSPSCDLCGTHSERREAREFAGCAADEILSGGSCQNRRVVGIGGSPRLLGLADEVIE